MAKLVLSMDGLVLKEIELTKERTSIGRRPHNDIVIDNLAISGEHAVLITILNDSFIEDLGSTNGTTVNGQPIKKHFLQNNDTVELGKYKLKFVVEAAKAGALDAGIPTRAPTRMQSQAPAPANTGAAPVATHPMRTQATTVLSGGITTAISNASTDPNARGHASSYSSDVTRIVGETNPSTSMPMPSMSTAPAASGAPSAQATIQIMSGPNAGKELMLSKALTTLGRPGVQVAVITRRPQGYFITHVEGASFPVLNGKALGLDAQALADHDVIELSGTKMEFFFR